MPMAIALIDVNVFSRMTPRMRHIGASSTGGLLLTAGGCRFQLNDAGQTPLGLAAGDRGVLKVFASGIDCWQRQRHGGHGWGTKEAVTTLLLVRQRLDGPAAPASASALVHLPEEIWLAVCAFLRSADFMP